MIYFLLAMALPFLAALIVLTVATSSWRVPAAFVAICGCGLLVLWIRYWIVSSAPGFNYDTSPSDTILMMWTGALAIAAIAYLIGATWWYGQIKRP